MKAVAFFGELKRRNVPRVAALYAAAAWALSQGIAQLGPLFHAPDWAMRWFVIACAIGFPFWLAFAWIYEITPSGLKRESAIAPGDTIAHSTGRKLDFWIIGILAVAVVLLITNQFVLHRDATSTANLAKIPQKSIVVLPFANEGGDKDQQYFSDGLSEDFITALSQFAGLKVIGRSSAFQFRNTKDDAQTIGAKLGVAHLLEGSVRRQGDEVRIRAELINTRDASMLWSQHYDRPYKDLFALQDDITKAVAGALKAKLLEGTNSTAVVQSDRPPSGNLAAYDAFELGQFYFQRGSEEDFRHAIEQFAQAARLDPNYAAAYAAAAETWVDLAGGYLGDADMSFAYAQAGIASNTAMRLNPNLAAAHLANSSVLVNADGDWNGWQTEAQRALELAPRSAQAYFQLSTAEAGLGHVKSAVELVRRALALNPLNGYWQSWLATYLTSLGHFDEAEAVAHKAVELSPDGALIYEELSAIEILRGNAVASLTAARRAPVGLNQDYATAQALQIGPDRAAADAALKDLIAKHGDDSAYAYFIADLYALRRDPKNMFKWLDRAWVNHRGVDIQDLLYDPFILRYQHDPRFAAFCKKVGLPTTTDAQAMP